MKPPRYRPSCLSRRAAARVARDAAAIPGYLSDLKPVRGRCRKPRCGSRWGIVRVTLDFRDPERVDRYAATECAKCGAVWRRVHEPSIASPAGYQAVRLTLILPASMHRWFARGHWHREGDDAVVIPEGNLTDLDEAARAHRKREDALAMRKARAKAKAEAEAVEQHRRTMDLLARLAAMDAARALEDAVA